MAGVSKLSGFVERKMIVVWRIVDSCNLACPFCAFDKRLGFARSQVDTDEVVRFLTVLSDYQTSCNNPVLVSWLGGEPFLFKPLESLTLSAQAKGLRVSATTNGTTLGNARVRRHIVENYQELTVSIDGFPAIHDALRGWPDGFNKLRKYVSALSEESKTNADPLKIRVNVVLMRNNINDFPRLCLELATWGVSEITFNQLGGRDRPEFYPANRLHLEDVDILEQYLSGLRTELASQGVALIGGDAYLNRIRDSARNIRRPIVDCSPGQSFLFIDEKGRVSPCSFTSEDYAINIRDLQTAGDIYDLSQDFSEMQRTRRSVQCDDCLSTQVCEKFVHP